MEELIKNLKYKISLRDNFLDILKEMKAKENNLPQEIKNIINKRTYNNEDMIKFFELCVYSDELGQFYTPKSLVELIRKMVSVDFDEVYEPTIGSGNLVAPYFDKKIYGQELDFKAKELLEILYPNINIEQGDTLQIDKFKDKKFNLILSNPPFNAKWEAIVDDRYEFEVPNNNANWAFVQHIWSKLEENGEAFIIMANGILSASNKKETLIREKFIKENRINCVISLPEKLFESTQIPVCLIHLKKNNKNKKVLFISGEEEKTQLTKKKNEVKHLKILEAFSNKQEEIGFSKEVSLEELEESDYSLVPGRYVGFVKEEIDEEKIKEEIKESSKELKKLFKEFNSLIPDVEKAIEKALEKKS